MYRDYVVDNIDTGATQIVSAITARDALAQVTGFKAISIIGLDYYSDIFHAQEPYPWWYEDKVNVTVTCECGEEYDAEVQDIHDVCTGGIITCNCGATLDVRKGSVYHERVFNERD